MDCHFLRRQPVISKNMGSLVRGIRDGTAATDMTAALFFVRERKTPKVSAKGCGYAAMGPQSRSMRALPSW